MDSRGSSWPAEVMEATQGRGVDLVLNSLVGDAISQGLGVLAPSRRQMRQPRPTS